MDRSVYDVFSKIPMLHTDRLVLRKMTVRDADDMYEYSCRPEVSRYLLWTPHTDIKVTRSYLRYLQVQYAQKKFYDWAVDLKSTGKMIGTCGFSRFDEENNAAEVGYVLNSDYWGLGYAAEALACVLDFGFQTLGFNRIYARILDGNTQSVRVAEKNLMRYEATHKNALLVKGEYKTYHIYAILKDEYDALFFKN